MSFPLANILKILKPHAAVAGLEISDTALRFIRAEDAKIEKVGIALDPGVIVDGRIQSRDTLLRALEALRKEIKAGREQVPVVVSVPPNNVYTQAFNLPTLADTNVQEAAELNLQMLSPIEAKSAYSDWQTLNESGSSDKLELLGAFAPKTIIDEFIDVLHAAHFSVVAVEFPGLAIGRVIREKAKDIDLAKPKVVLVISSDGLDFLILKDGNLYFSYFVSWSSINGGAASREIPLALFTDVLTREMKRVFTFYGSHWGGQVSDLLLVTHGLYEEIVKVIQTNFPAIKISNVQLEDSDQLGPSWYAALGGALRGQLPPDEDTFISLAAVGTEEQFYQGEIISFVKLWRNIIATVGIFMIAAFITTEVLVTRAASQVQTQINSLASAPGSAELNSLTQKAREFNALVGKALIAKDKSQYFSDVLQQVTDTAQAAHVTIVRLYIDGSRRSAVITGQAASEVATVDFKNRLTDQPGFKQISLPLSNITSNPDNSVSFSLNFSF